jgi:integrase/recombinase XerD
MTIADVLAGHLAELRQRKLKPATVLGVQRDVEHFWRFLAGRQVEDLRLVSRHDVDAYATAIAARYAQSTCNTKLGTLRGFFEHLVEAGKLLASPAEHVRIRRVYSPIGQVLEDGELDQVLMSINTGLPMGIRDRAIIELAWATGLRRGEIHRLEVRDVDLEARIVRVCAGKGDKDRLVPMTAEAARWVGEYVREVRPLLVAKGRRTDGRLFLCWWGRPLTYSGLHTLLRRISRGAGVSFNCHALRRTMATGLLRGGAEITVVAEILGHSSLGPTARYTKVVPADLRDEQDRTHPRAGGGHARA